jgi:integrase
MATAGLVAVRTNKKAKGGRTAKRETNDISFHALRHTATSLLKNAGVSDSVVMDMIGHNSSAMSAIYTHIDSGAKRRAMDAMPDITENKT